MGLEAALVALVIGFGGVSLGAWLTRRNDRGARTDELLAQALNDAVAAVAEVAQGRPDGQVLYASAVARIALHGSPEVVHAWRRHQDDANTVTQEGRDRMVEAVQAARGKLRHGTVSDADLHILLFGHQRQGDDRRSP